METKGPGASVWEAEVGMTATKPETVVLPAPAVALRTLGSPVACALRKGQEAPQEHLEQSTGGGGTGPEAAVCGLS